ncbi:MAG TPA: transcription termination factor Rho, partial [Phycisphaerales bacterium]|nr:transcription termination factor Rho [Phycisphaerales bacterium]
MAKQTVAEDKSESREPRGRVTQRGSKSRVVTAGEPASERRVEPKPAREERAEKPERSASAREERATREARATEERPASREEREDGRGGESRGEARPEGRAEGRPERGEGRGPEGGGRYETRGDRGHGGDRYGPERGDRPERGNGAQGGYPQGQGGGGGHSSQSVGPQGGPSSSGPSGGPGGGYPNEYRDRDRDRGPGGGGGGGGYRDFQDSFGRRKRKKKRRGGGGEFHGHWGQRPSDFNLPSDDELEREAAEIERVVAKGAIEAAKSGLTITALQKMDIEKLHAVAQEAGLEDFAQIPKQELVFKILKAKAASQGLMVGEGTLEIMPDKFGFLRSPVQSYLSGPDDIYVSPTQIRRYGLKKGMVVRGLIRPPKESERYFALLRVDEVNGRDPKSIHGLSNFEDLTPLHPEERYILETTPNEIEMRIVDLVAPVGKGQRALIVAPPRTGKTVLMQKMTRAISTNYPDVKIIVLLVDERPEEVTDFRRNCAGPNIEVVASTFDEQSARHVQVAEMVIEKAKRMVEFGDH